MAKLERAFFGTLALAACVLTLLQARQVSRLREQFQSLQQQQASAIERIHQLQQERDEASRRNAFRCNNNNLSDNTTTEILRLRGEVAVLRAQLSEKLQVEKHKLAEPSTLSEFKLGGGARVRIAYDPAVWKPLDLANSVSGAPQSMTWGLNAPAADWLQITLASHPEQIDEAQYRQQLLDRQTFRGDPAELVGQRQQTLGSREWTIFEFRNGNTKPPRAELHYFLAVNDGYVSAFVVTEEANLPRYRANVAGFIHRIHME